MALISGGVEITPVTSPDEGAASWRSFARSLGGVDGHGGAHRFSLRDARPCAVYTFVSLPTSGGAGSKALHGARLKRRRERFSRVLSTASCRTGRPRRVGDSSWPG